MHRELGVYCKEKQYADLLDEKLAHTELNYKRELPIGNSGNIVDFIIDDKILLELKAKRIITIADYYQTQRYLQETNLRLGIIINFRNRTIHPKRIVKIDQKNTKNY